MKGLEMRKRGEWWKGENWHDRRRPLSWVHVATFSLEMINSREARKQKKRRGRKGRRAQDAKTNLNFR